MGHTAVIYKLKYGSTKRYAEWIAGAKKISDEDIEVLVVNKGKLDFTDEKSIAPLIHLLEAPPAQ
ncbi:MAG: hypothetical protein GX781_05770 [Clostridiales bacterium]|nr:hypothetical protein [Clostridiales bacterium]